MAWLFQTLPNIPSAAAGGNRRRRVLIINGESMINAKLSTAITVAFGPVLDSTGADFTTAAVAEVRISKNSGTPAALDASATLVHREAAIYELALTANDISATGQATITLNKATYIAPPIRINVMAAKPFDSIVSGSDNLEVDAVQLGGDTQSATDLKHFADAGYDPTSSKVQGVVTVDTATAVTTVNGLAAGVITNASIVDNAITASKLNAACITDMQLASNTITAAKIDTGAIVASKFANGAITSSVLANDAITAAKIHADAGTEIANAVWNLDLSNPGPWPVDSAGGLLELAAIDPLSENVDTYTGIQAGKVLADILADTDGTHGVVLAGDLTTTMKTSVKTQVVAALSTDTQPEPGQGLPPVDASLGAKINYLYKNWRNRKRQTATTWELLNDAETVVDQKATVSDSAGTATKTIISSGP